ncbi:MAG: hypothetical protein QXS20_06495 [Candidatus Thorarchaeota archaeon]
MRILFIWDTAGAMTPVAEWLNEQGHESAVLMHSAYDRYGRTSISKTSVLFDTLREFYTGILSTIRRMRPTHIHVSCNLRALTIARAGAPHLPMVMQYHGDDVRDRESVHIDVRLLADKVIVSTPDL